MNKLETAQLLTVAAGFDRFIAVDEVTTTAWQLMLDVVSYETALEAVMGFYRTWEGKTQLTVKYVLDNVSDSRETIAKDVRYARARQMIPRDWPETTPIPEDVAARVKELRAENAEWLSQNQWALSR